MRAMRVGVATRTAGGFALLACVASTSCSSRDGSVGSAAALPAQQPSGTETTGTVGLALQLGPGVDVPVADYSLTGPDGFSQSGEINLEGSQTISVILGGIPSGDGYAISITAETNDGGVTCAGSAGPFSISARTTTSVSVVVVCSTPVEPIGNVQVTGTVGALCPTIDSLSVLPLSVDVGSSLSLLSSARGPDPSSLTYAWTVMGGGTFSAASAADSSFVCTVGGTPTVTLTVTDGGDAASCSMSQSVQVDCTCRTADDCPGSDSFCAVRSCTQGTCGVQFTAAGTVTPTQPQGNCQQTQCDGAGNVASVPDDANLPANTNPCTKATCTQGVPSNPPLPVETACGTPAAPMVCDGAGRCVQCVQPLDCGSSPTCDTCVDNLCGVAAYGLSCSNGGGTICSGDGSCVALSVDVVRVGDGSQTPNANASPAFLEEHKFDGTSYGPFAAPLALPTAPVGSNEPLTITGTGVGEGSLSRSTDGRYLALAGYVALPGASVTSAETDVGRIDANGAVDSSTVLSNQAFVTPTVRAAATFDGAEFWVAGSGANVNNVITGGLWYIPRGATTGGSQLVGAQMRGVGIFDGQLFGSGTTPNSTTMAVYMVGSGLPTTGTQSVAVLPGLPAASSQISAWDFVLLQVGSASTGPDTLYIANARAPSLPPNGIQKWTLSGGTWSLAGTLNLATQVGFRNVTGLITAPNTVTLFATTADSGTNNRLVTFVDRVGSPPPTGTVIYTSPANEILHGVALPPHR